MALARVLSIVAFLLAVLPSARAVSPRAWSRVRASYTVADALAAGLASAWTRVRDAFRAYFEMRSRESTIRELRRVDGEVLAWNQAMLGYVEQHGFRVREHPDNGRLLRIELEL